MADKPKKPWHHKKILEEMYNDQELTIRDIADIFNTTASNILYFMRKFAIPTRPHNIGDVYRGKPLDEERRQKLSEIAQERFKDRENHPMFGKHHTEEAKQKMSETKKAKWQERREAAEQSINKTEDQAIDELSKDTKDAKPE